MKDLPAETRLLRRGTRYYFRVKVPVDLLDHYSPKKEIKESLGTSDFRDAARLVRVRSVEVFAEFDRLRRNLASPTVHELSDDEIERLTARRIVERVQEHEDDRFDQSVDQV